MSTPSPRLPRVRRPSSGGRVFKGVLSERPYPRLEVPTRAWAAVPPRQIRLSELITVKAELRLDVLLSEDSTFFGDLFCHVVHWRGDLYLDDGLHRAVQAALQQRTHLHVRIAELDDDGAFVGPATI